jgi:hypothetical protein
MSLLRFLSQLLKSRGVISQSHGLIPLLGKTPSKLPSAADDGDSKVSWRHGDAR